MSSHRRHDLPIQPASMVSGIILPQISAQPPTQDDWNRHRPLIKRLYADEGKTLREVMDVLIQHGLKASSKMFKQRISKWGLDKSNKERDMIAILRKKTERDAIGRATCFRVRGKVITIEQVLHYFKRKMEKTELALSAPSTPSDISYRTPSPRPEESAHIGASKCMIGGEIGKSKASPETSISLFCEPDDGKRTDLLQVSHKQHNSEPEMQSILSFFSNQANVPQSPSPLQAAQVPERLFQTIKGYLGSSVGISWTTDKVGFCKSAMGARLPDRTGNFYDYCYMAVELLRNQSHLESRRALSKVFALLDSVLQDEHPNALDTLLEVMLLFSRHGFWQQSTMLRDYIRDMAVSVIGRESPWVQIVQLIGALDNGSLEQIVIQSWQCTIDAFEKGLGSSNRFSLDVRLRFIRAVYGHTDPINAESIYRTLLATCERDSSNPEKDATNTSKVMLELGWHLVHQRQDIEAEKLGQDVLRRAHQYNSSTDRNHYQIEALRLMAWSQYHQDKRFAAVENMQDALAMDTRGECHPSYVGNIIILEGWFRRWGYEAEGDEMKAQIDKVIGRDEIDELMETVLSGAVLN